MDTRSLQERSPENPRRFKIHRCLGRGGFGEVYRATMSRDGGVTTEVAVKVLAADVDPDSDAVRRLKDEGRLLGALSHPAILKVVDLVLLAGRVALVTEYVEGQDLHRCLGQGAPPGTPDLLPLRAFVEALGEVAEALHAAWTTESPYGGGPMHLVHRDVKPQNVRIGVHGQVKLLDFGIARAANVQRESNTQTNLLMGSWPYLAPERLQEEEANPTPSIDVYALGCTLFEGLVGERLMEPYKLLDLYKAVDEPGAFARLVQGRLEVAEDRAPATVIGLLREMLAPDPEARPSPEEVAHRCDELAPDLGGAGMRRWARERVWPPVEEQDGPLTDYDLTEGMPADHSGATKTLDPSSFYTPTPMMRTIEPDYEEDGPTVMMRPSATPPPPPPFGTPSGAYRVGAPPAAARGPKPATPVPSPPREAAAAGRPRTATPAAAPPRGSGPAAAATGSGARPRQQGPSRSTPVPARSLNAAETVVLGHDDDQPPGPVVPDLLAIAIDEPAPAAAEPPARDRTVSLVFGLIGTAAVLFLLAAVGLVGIGVWWYQNRVATAVPVPVPVSAAPVPEATPAPAPMPTPEAVPAPAPVTPKPAPATPSPAPAAPKPAPAAPSPAPAPAAPSPAPAAPTPEPAPAEPASAPVEPAPAPVEPAPAEPAPAGGTFAALVVTGDATVELQGDFGGYRAGTPALPPGSYRVFADFGEGMVDTGQVTQAIAGGQVVVSCEKASKQCFTTP